MTILIQRENGKKEDKSVEQEDESVEKNQICEKEETYVTSQTAEGSSFLFSKSLVHLGGDLKYKKMHIIHERIR